MWYRILSLESEGSTTLWKFFNLLSTIYRESNVYKLKEGPFIIWGGNYYCHKLAVLAKYLLATVLLFSIAY